MALPIVAWRMLSDNRDLEDIEKAPSKTHPYGEPMIMGGDGLLQSAFGEGNYKDYSFVTDSSKHPGSRHDFRDGWDFQYAEFIPDIRGVLKKPEGDVIWWEPVC